jgi:hypothetical protein
MGFVVAFLDGAGVERRLPLAAAVEVALEAAAPFPSFPSYRGQRNFPGLWWETGSVWLSRRLGRSFNPTDALLVSATA